MSDYRLKVTLKTKVLNLIRLIFTIPAIEKMLRSRTSGKDENSIYAKLVPPNYLYKNKALRNIIVDEINYQVDISDVVGHYIYFGFRESAREKLFTFIKPGMTILDVGANVGTTMLPFAKLTGNSGKIYAFEPDEENYIKALKNISLNNFKNITLIQKGAGNENKTFPLYHVEANNAGMNRIIEGDVDFPYATIEVIKLDDFVLSGQIEKIDFIKIDVEGFEMQVLLGAIEIIKKNKPVLFIELNDSLLQNNHYTAKELLQLLEQYNYRIFDAGNNQSVSPVTDLRNRHIDVYAIA